MNIFTLYFLRYTYSLSSLLATTFNHLSWCLFIEFLCGKDRNGGSDNRWTEVAVTDKKRKKHKRYVCLSALVVSQQSYAAAPQKLKKPKHEISESISRQLDKMKKKKKTSQVKNTFWLQLQKAEGNAPKLLTHTSHLAPGTAFFTKIFHVVWNF